MKQIRVFSVAAALLVVAGTAQAQHGQNDQRAHQDDRAAAPHAAQQQRSVPENRAEAARPPVVQAQQRAEYNDQHRDQRVDQQRVDQQRVDQQRAEQQRFEQQRAEQQRIEQQRMDGLRDRQRDAELDRQRDLQLREREQQLQLDRLRQQTVINRSYDREYQNLNNYRYSFGGVYRETNQYGADALRQAVDRGYQDGYRAGLADRSDRAPANVQRAFEFQEGGFSYAGAYVPQGDYQYYLREGFQRGYDDAYGNRARYGTYYNGNPSILGDIAAGILGLTLLR